jgi:molybdopterin converting factor small subunit
LVIVRIHGPETPKELSEFNTGSEAIDLEGLLNEMAGANEYYHNLLIRDGNLRTDLAILINGRSCMFLDGLKAKIGKGDLVDILLPMIGG